MQGLYPSLSEKFRSEGICPICLSEMGVTPKFSCVNGHTVCPRCKPYYSSCPTCQSPLDREMTEEYQYHMPPAIHSMPHPYPLYPPSAPFIDHERSEMKEYELRPCQFSRLGCYARLPEHLRDLHESRCQFRPHLEHQNLPTDLAVGDSELVDCKYHFVGCNVRLPEWRKYAHENHCSYKVKDDMADIEASFTSLNVEDEYRREKIVECTFATRGCKVMVPRTWKEAHEEYCKYRNYGDYDENRVLFYVPDGVEEQDECEPCYWSFYGCREQPRRGDKQAHEDQCFYKRLPCRYKAYGCREMLKSEMKECHEESCSYYS